MEGRKRSAPLTPAVAKRPQSQPSSLHDADMRRAFAPAVYHESESDGAKHAPTSTCTDDMYVPLARSTLIAANPCGLNKPGRSEGPCSPTRPSTFSTSAETTLEMKGVEASVKACAHGGHNVLHFISSSKPVCVDISLLSNLKKRWYRSGHFEYFMKVHALSGVLYALQQ